jgi:hypothetical protein
VIVAPVANDVPPQLIDLPRTMQPPELMYRRN